MILLVNKCLFQKKKSKFLYDLKPITISPDGVTERAMQPRGDELGCGGMMPTTSHHPLINLA
jgi:hypothetical protein